MGRDFIKLSKPFFDTKTEKPAHLIKLSQDIFVP